MTTTVRAPPRLPQHDWAVSRPAPPLRGLVEHYLGYRMEGFEPGLHRGLPSRFMTFIVGIGQPIDVVAQTDPGQPPDKYRCVLSGLQASSALIAHDGYQEGVAIELSPLGARALLGLPAGELWDTSLESSVVLGPAGDELWERLQPAASWPARFAACDAVLLRRLGDQQIAPELAGCWQAIVASGGAAPVERLAAETGYSRQHLTRRFRAEFGLGPKLASQVVRFERASKLIRSAAAVTPLRPQLSLADIAATCGYADQAHLAREARMLAACAPSILAQDLPAVQEQ